MNLNIRVAQFRQYSGFRGIGVLDLVGTGFRGQNVCGRARLTPNKSPLF